MFGLTQELELRRITISSLITCIYLPTIVTVISFKGLLYSVGNASSFYIVFIIFVAELLKSFYLNSESENDIHIRRAKIEKGGSKEGDILRSAVFLLCVKFCFFLGVMLFGAPVLNSHEETMMLSTLLTLLTVFPLILHTGVEPAMQLFFGLRHFKKDTIIEMLIRNAVMTIVGSWAGAVVIPLDWNTPWQVWPIPCYLGAIGGFLLSNVLTVVKVTAMNAAHKYPLLRHLVSVLHRLSLKY